MLVLKITMMRGRTPEQKEALIAQLSQAAAKRRSVAARRNDARSH
ncbi:MAG: tautomerase family protein [Chloroflexi bacterium]|nr:MAG: tautomerase family protein [Chloroflexota bacterium]